MNLGVGSLIGIVLGIALAVVREQMDSSLKTPADIESRLNLTFLGMLPSLDEDENPYGTYGKKKKKKGKQRRPQPIVGAIPRFTCTSVRSAAWPKPRAASARTSMFMNPDKPHRMMLGHERGSFRGQDHRRVQRRHRARAERQAHVHHRLRSPPAALAPHFRALGRRGRHRRAPR